jgi:hypothetical protein
MKHDLLHQGPPPSRTTFAPSTAVSQMLESLSDLDRMERMANRVLEEFGWQELLDTP